MLSGMVSLVGNHEYLPVMNTYLVKLTSISYQKLLIGVNQSFFSALGLCTEMCIWNA